MTLARFFDDASVTLQQITVTMNVAAASPDGGGRKTFADHAAAPS